MLRLEIVVGVGITSILGAQALGFIVRPPSHVLCYQDDVTQIARPAAGSMVIAVEGCGHAQCPHCGVTG